MSEPRVIRARPLTREGFAPFGDVISAGEGEGASANQGTAVRFDWVAKLESDRAQARANMVFVRSMPQALPFALKLLEHHPHSSQAFVPMRCARFLVVVAPTAADGGPDTERIEAFVCGPGQGINYHRGTWHHPMAVLDAPAEFAMLVWEDGTPADCVERRLEHRITVDVG